MKTINKIIFFTDTAQTGLHLLDIGQQFAVNMDGAIKYYTLTSKTGIDENTSIQNAIENKIAKEVRTGEVEPTLKIYGPNIHFHTNELFTDPSKSKFYVALQDFIATGNFDADKENGFIKNIGETVYKQIEATVNAGDIYIIPLKNQNTQYNKHCFIEMRRAPQSDVLIILSDFNETDNKWNYDERWVNKDGYLYLKTVKYYKADEFTSNDGTQIFEKTIDINDYADIAYISASVI